MILQKNSSDGFDELRNKVKEGKKENEELPLPKNVDLNVYIKNNLFAIYNFKLLFSKLNDKGLIIIIPTIKANTSFKFYYIKKNTQRIN